MDEASVHQCVQIDGPLCICAAVLSSVWDQAGPGGMARVKRMHTICVRMLHWWLGKCGSIPLGQFEVIGNSTDRCTVHAFHVAVIITCDVEARATWVTLEGATEKPLASTLTEVQFVLSLTHKAGCRWLPTEGV